MDIFLEKLRIHIWSKKMRLGLRNEGAMQYWRSRTTHMKLNDLSTMIGNYWISRVDFTTIMSALSLDFMLIWCVCPLIICIAIICHIWTKPRIPSLPSHLCYSMQCLAVIMIIWESWHKALSYYFCYLTINYSAYSQVSSVVHPYHLYCQAQLSPSCQLQPSWLSFSLILHFIHPPPPTPPCQ